MLPLFKNKHQSRRIADAKQILSHFGLDKNIEIIKRERVKTAILIFSNSLKEEIVKRLNPKQIKIGSGDALLFSKSHIIIRSGFGIGAPITAIVVEELITMGIERIFIVGTAGTLDPTLKIGEYVICTGAYRDEGTSYHYYPPTPTLMPAPKKGIRELKKILKTLGIKYTLGYSWTTDAPYMETVDEIHYYRSQGVKTVEMEASLLFTMSKVFNIITGAVFVISDILDPQKGHQLGFIQTTEYLFRVIEGFVGR